jgi:hypothetical protein
VNAWRARLASPAALLALLLTVGALLALPLATGERSLVLRDVLTSHLPLKWFGAAELAAGRIPATNPGWALGQPFRGDPNALAYYPGNLLYLVLPFWSAFNLHYLLHWLLALVGMRRLAHELGQGEWAALAAGCTYAGSGYLISALTFYNLLAVAAWAPWLLAGLARPSRRGTLAAGVAGGLMLLAGEPLSAALVAPLALLVAVRRRGWRAGLGAAAASGVLAGLLALPQLVSTLLVLPATYRATHGVPAAQAAANSLELWRLWELVLPLPWGALSEAPPRSHWATGILPWAPYVLSLHVGVVGFALALGAGRRRWAAVAAAAVVAAWAGGLAPEATARLTLGLFRYPQKLLFPFTLAAALLAGWGLERATGDRRRGRLIAAAGIVLLAAALLAWTRPAELAATLGRLFAPGAPPAVLAAQAAAWTRGLLAAGALLVATAAALTRRWPALVVAAQVAGLAQLAPLVATVPVGELERPAPWSVARSRPTVVATTAVDYPWEPRPPYPGAAHAMAARQALDRDLLEPPFATLAGLRSPLAPNLTGFSSPEQVHLAAQLARADWPARWRWLGRLGVATLTRDGRGATGVAPRETIERHGVRLERVEVPAPRDFPFRPRRVVATASPAEAWSRVAGGELDPDTVTAPRVVAQGANGRVATLSELPDELLLEIEGDGGLVVVERAWSPRWRATLAAGASLPTLPADLVLLAVEVPPGRHRVRLAVDARSEKIAGVIALLTLTAVAVAARRRA